MAGQSNSYLLVRVIVIINLKRVSLIPALFLAAFPLKLIFLSDGLEQKSRVKRPRAPPPPDPENDVDGDFDERNNDLSTSFVPAGFLSPSVLEYLELGKSIPGNLTSGEDIR